MIGYTTEGMRHSKMNSSRDMPAGILDTGTCVCKLGCFRVLFRTQKTNREELITWTCSSGQLLLVLSSWLISSTQREVTVKDHIIMMVSIMAASILITATPGATMEIGEAEI